MTVEDLSDWSAGLDDLMARIAGRFRRVEPRRRARAYVVGLLSPLAGKNSWTLAEIAGDGTPDGMQGTVALADLGQGKIALVKSSSRSRQTLPARSAFAGFRFPAEVITVAVRWYLRYGLS